MEKKETAWKQGPLPADTYNWGGVVPASDPKRCGFYWADFCGDHVKMFDKPNFREFTVLTAEDVAWFNNSLDLPPECGFGATRLGG